MKKYFLKIAVYLLLLALPLTLIFAYVQSKPTVFSGTLLGTIYHKSGLLDEVGSPRIIFVGGSSCPYATDCERISEELGMPCINLGVTSYFGLAYYRNLLKGHIGEGDIIVLMPEAAMMRNKINYEALWEGVENRPSLLRAVPVSYWKNMALADYKYAAHKLDLLDAGYGKKGEIYSPDFGYFVIGYIRTEKQISGLLTDIAMKDLTNIALEEANSGVHDFHTDDEYLPAPAAPTATPVPDIELTDDGTAETSFNPEATETSAPDAQTQQNGSTKTADVLVVVFFTLAGVAIAAIIAVLIYSAVNNRIKSSGVSHEDPGDDPDDNADETENDSGEDREDGSDEDDESEEDGDEDDEDNED